MLTMKAQYSLGNAEKYFKEHLRVGDYYMAGRNTMGQWIGKGAEELGLHGETATDDFVNLCRNLNPQTGERLTQRHNSKRAGDTGEVANRRVFYDFTLSPPKSVSIAALVGDDQRIVAAHDEAIQSALRQLEFYAAARVIAFQLTIDCNALVYRYMLQFYKTCIANELFECHVWWISNLLFERINSIIGFVHKHCFTPLLFFFIAPQLGKENYSSETRR